MVIENMLVFPPPRFKNGSIYDEVLLIVLETAGLMVTVLLALLSDLVIVKTVPSPVIRGRVRTILEALALTK
jgi:hypothetical protein